MAETLTERAREMVETACAEQGCSIEDGMEWLPEYFERFAGELLEEAARIAAREIRSAAPQGIHVYVSFKELAKDVKAAIRQLAGKG